MGEVGGFGFFVGAQQVVAVGFHGVAAQFFVAGHAPHVCGDAEFVGQYVLGFEDFVEDGSASQELCAQFFFGVFGGFEAVHAFEDAFFGAVGHWRHGVVFVADGEVVEDAFLFLVHAADAVADDGGDFEGEGGVVA